jgi:hypothetical protein
MACCRKKAGKRRNVRPYFPGSFRDRWLEKY